MRNFLKDSFIILTFYYNFEYLDKFDLAPVIKTLDAPIALAVRKFTNLIN